MKKQTGYEGLYPGKLSKAEVRRINSLYSGKPSKESIRAQKKAEKALKRNLSVYQTPDDPRRLSDRTTGVKLDVGKTAGTIALSSLLATGLASTVETVNPDIIDVPQAYPLAFTPEINTVHDVVKQNDQTQYDKDLASKIPLGAEAEGNNLYSVPIELGLGYDENEGDQLEIDHKLNDYLEYIAATAWEIDNRTTDELKEIMNNAFERYDSGIDVNIEELIQHANLVAIDDDQRAQLDTIAEELGYDATSTLIADYGSGAIHDGTVKEQLDAILVRNELGYNERATMDLELQFGSRDVQATIYKTDEGYMIVANQYEHTEEEGDIIKFSLVAIPLPFLLRFRRRTQREQWAHDDAKRNRKYRREEVKRRKRLPKYKPDYGGVGGGYVPKPTESIGSVPLEATRRVVEGTPEPEPEPQPEPEEEGVASAPVEVKKRRRVGRWVIPTIGVIAFGAATGVLISESGKLLGQSPDEAAATPTPAATSTPNPGSGTGGEAVVHQPKQLEPNSTVVLYTYSDGDLVRELIRGKDQDISVADVQFGFSA